MSNPITTITVTIDNRLRLMGAALAATTFPETSQQRRRYHAHAHARATMKYMHDHGYSKHAAIKTLQGLLDQQVPLEALYTLAFSLAPDTFALPNPPKWMPTEWNVQLKDFMHEAKLPEYWENTRNVWDAVAAQARNVFKQVHFKEFLKPFLGEIADEFLFMPNIGYPADDELGLRVGNQLVAIVPPPQAWGDSPPWAFDEPTMVTHAFRGALGQYGRLLLTEYLRANTEKVAEATKKELPVTDQFRAQHPEWEDQFTALFITAAVAMYLEDYVSEAEYKAYLLMERKVRGLTFLPATISVLRRFLQEKAAGKHYSSLAEFLSVFPAQLRVAKKIVMM